MNIVRKSAKPDWWLKRTAKADVCVDRRIAVSSHVTNALLSGIMVLLGYLSLSSSNAFQEWQREDAEAAALTQTAWQRGENMSANREFCLRAAQIAAERARGRSPEAAGTILTDLDSLLGQPCTRSNTNPTAIAYALMTQDTPAYQASLARLAAPLLTRTDTSAGDQVEEGSETALSPEPRLSIGYGVNWNSPFGPMRVDMAHALPREPDSEAKAFTFDVGTQF